MIPPLKNHGNQPKIMINHETTLKNHGNQPKAMETMKPPWNQPKTKKNQIKKSWWTMKPPWKTMETSPKPCKSWNHLENHGNQPINMKNYETTLKNHGNQPKTIKNHETTLKNMETNQKPWNHATSLSWLTDRPFKKVIIFRDRQTELHHNIYIVIVIIASPFLPSSLASSLHPFFKCLCLHNQYICWSLFEIRFFLL